MSAIPYNAEAERLILGGILLDNSLAAQVEGVLRADEFFADAHRRTLKAMGRLIARGLAVDLVTLQDELQRANDLELIGGAAYIATLIDGCPRLTNVEEYVRIVKEKARERKLIEIGNWLAHTAAAGDTDADELLASVEGKLADLHGANLKDDLISSSDAVARGLEYLEKLWEAPDGILGARSGLPDVDNLLRGFRPGLLYFLAARPGCGKTSLALNVAHNTAATEGSGPVLFVSLEMPVRELSVRALSTAARIDSDKLLSGKLTSDERRRLYKASESEGRLDLHYIERARRTDVSAIKHRALRLKRQGRGLSMIVVDYIGLVTMPQSDKKHEAVERLANDLKALAMELDVPILVLHQMNRDIEKGDREPEMSDLRDAGEQPADVVMFIHNPTGDPHAPERKLLIKKNRHGRTGVISLLWWKAESRFECQFGGDVPTEYQTYGERYE